MSHLIRQLLLEVIRERSWSLSAVSRRLTASEDRSRLSKMLRAERPFNLDDLDRVLAIIGEPESVFWRRYLDQLNGSPQALVPTEIEPAAILRAVAGPHSPALPDVIRQLTESRLPHLDREMDVPLSSQLTDLDQLRFHDRQAALRQAEKWIATCADRLFRRQHDSHQLTEVITALGFWASATRTTGHSRTASAVFSLAFSLCGPMRSSLPYAYLLWRSSPVLIDGGFPSVAQTFVERAYSIYDIHGETSTAVNVLLSLGGQAIYTGRWSLARNCFHRCLSQPTASDDQKAAATCNIAALHDRMGEYEKALACIEASELLLESSQPRFRTSARWVRAKALAHGNGEQQIQAQEEFSHIRADVISYCEPIDPFLLFCDHATVLIRLGNEKELRTAASAIAGLLPQLEATPLYATVAQEVTGILSGVKVSAGTLRLLRQKLEETRT